MRYGLLLLAAAVVAQAVEMKPFEMVWQPGNGVLADLSFLQDAPAGRHGFVQVRNGHLARGDGQRLRIWGVNFSFTASLPAKEAAPAVAAHLARFGINCVRIHHLDWRAPRGIIDSTRPDSRGLDPAAQDRLDFFVSELKKRGIYVNLNLNVARAFQAGDGVKDADQLGYAKAITYFDPRIIELQKEYAKAMLAHRNPYTGTEYRSEPAVAMVEIINENSIIESWVRGRLLGKGRKPGDATWSDIPSSYERDLTALYHQWLAKRGQPAVARLAPSEFKSADPARFHNETSFYMDLEDRFFQDMYRYLKSELGVKMPVVGTSAHAGGMTPYPLIASASKLDIVDTHTYWQHPTYLTDSSGKRTGFEIRNTPAVNEPARMPFIPLTRGAVKGKPFMVSEVNHPYPNEYAAEGIPLLAAYGAFHDWDAIFWYSFEHSAAELWDKPKLPGNFDMRQDPVKMTQWAAGALTFLRGDIRPAKLMLERSYTAEQVRASLLLPSNEQPLFTPGTLPVLPLLHGMRIASFNAPAAQPPKPEPAPQPPYVSDTGQIAWHSLADRRGFVTVDAERTQSLIGWLEDCTRTTQNLALKMTNPFGASTLVSMDPAPIAKASRLLLVVGTKAANRGLTWNEKRTIPGSEGQPGMTIEAPEGTVVLRNIQAKSVKATPLDGGGRQLAPPVALTKTSAGWELPLAPAVATPWYLIQVAR